MCLSEEGWAYYLKRDQTIYFQDAFEYGSPLKNVPGFLKHIDCKSTPEGGIVVASNEAGDAYRRTRGFKCEGGVTGGDRLELGQYLCEESQLTSNNGKYLLKY